MFSKGTISRFLGLSILQFRGGGTMFFNDVLTDVSFSVYNG